ncbi:MAG: prepilin-type N-terminal cleavage/methylation domain-containing protein [Synergistaceae bacterium]|jgi:prepilin-type N-terminal cleavage/methylation domain-containing protein|nr:prepilin-type N-terminal cleavage/methylation domain-containing protein [Synergistaceae bacterium]
MAFFRRGKNEGFSLVELLLVIVLIAILMAIVTLSGANMLDSTNAQTEARRLIRTLQSLRSAWLACYADTQQMPGITVASANPAELRDLLGFYIDRSLADETARYGNIDVQTGDASTVSPNPDDIYIGFTGTWNLPANAERAKDVMIEVLDAQAGDYEIVLDDEDESAYIRVR